MNRLRKDVIKSGLCMMAIVGVAGLIKIAWHRHHCAEHENNGKKLDERLKDSILSLNKATAHIQSVFEKIKLKKS
ncbi:MAG: hypothetical protein PHC61_06345 [Chitinivibrionales bacterium]|nr:hypothetical protein [Chitinivibrionales bacterium]